MTEAGSIVGTAQYLSPEQARGAPVDPRSDLYSLGIVLYEMLTGKVPYTGDTPVEIAMKHLSQVPAPPSELRPDVPHDLDAIVMRALAKDPEQRYASAEEMDADLARVARGVAVSRETEDAMTQVLSGAGITSAQTMVQRPRSAIVAPPAPPVYRAPTPYYDYEEPPRGRSVWPWLLALGLILAGAAGGWFLYEKVQDQLNNNKPVGIPDETLVQKSLAARQLRAAGFIPKFTYAANATVAKGFVASESPPGGTKYPKGSVITLTVSTGKPQVVVPAVVGLDITSAIEQLAGAGFQTKVNRIFSGEPADTVTAEQPHSVDKIDQGSVVHINVSKGAKPIPVPDERGAPFANAKSALQGQGFVVSRQDVTSDQPQDQVVDENPAPGTPEPRGTTITLSVSKGPAPSQIPDVTGENQSDAEQTLTADQLTPNVVPVPVTDPSQDGIVQTETPPPGSPAKQGETVTIQVGQLQQGGGPPSGTTTTATTTTTP